MRYRRLFLPENSYYFTLVTYRRRPILVTHIGELREAFVHTKTRIRFRLDAIVVLPDHIHMILTPDEAERYPEIITQLRPQPARNFQKTSPSGADIFPVPPGRGGGLAKSLLRTCHP